MHEVWDFGDDVITCEVRPTAQVDVGAGVVGQFLSNYFTENGHIIPILSQKFINGSVECLGITKFHRNGGLFWDDNLLDPHHSWGEGGTTTNQNWGVQPVGPAI